MQISSERIATLEEILAHQEKTIEDLSQQLAAQWKITNELESKLTILTRRLAAIEGDSLPPPHISKPPHY